MSKPWAVINPDSDQLQGCHATEEEARRQQAALYSNVPDTRGGDGTMQTKTFPLVEMKADLETGTFSALASVFGNVDLVGDRMMPGSFKNTLAKWRASGDPLPIILSHKWDDPWATIGEADPRAVVETDRGLLVQGRLDLENPLAKQVHNLMSRRLLKGWSFGYTVPKGGQKRANGANEITEVDLVEVGPTLKGANPEAQLQAVKSGMLQPDQINWALKDDGAAETKAPGSDSATMSALMDRMGQLMNGDPPSPEAMLAFARRVVNDLGGGKSDEPAEPDVPKPEDDPTSTTATNGIEGGKADAPRPRDPLADQFERILLGLE